MTCYDGEVSDQISSPRVPWPEIPIRGQNSVPLHWRCFKKGLSDQVNESYLRDKNGDLYQPASDWAYFIPMMEMSGLKRIAAINKVLYAYNKHSKNDYILYGKKMMENVREIREAPPAPEAPANTKLTNWKL